MINFRSHKKLILFLQALIFSCSSSLLFATRTASRNFSNLENSTDFIVKKQGQITTYFFMTSGTSAVQRGSDARGCSPIELWGKYNFRDLIVSRRVFDPTYTNPLAASLPTRVGTDLFYRVDSEIKAAGLMFGYDHKLGNCAIKNARWSVGASLPIISAQTFVNFLIDRSGEDLPGQSNGPGFTMSTEEEAALDVVRRTFHQEIRLAGNTWNKVAAGDLDLHIGWTYERDHWLKMRNVIIQNCIGMLIPLENYGLFSYPSSVALSGSGHLGIFNDLFAEFELKSNWKFGLLLSGLWQCDKTRLQRVSVYKEPAPFSPLTSDVRIKPGFTFKFAPSFALENILEGVNVKATYTYLYHGEDTWTQILYTASKKSYLNQDFSDVRAAMIAMEPATLNPKISPSDLIENVSSKSLKTSFIGHYITLNVAYDSNQTLNNWKYDPVFFVNYDYPLDGVGSVKNHELRLGIKLHF